MFDLHTHTSFSDGQYTPGELVSLAKAADVTTLAITDHDTTDGILEGKKAGKEQGIAVIGGIEISAKSDAEMHILGYFVDEKSPDLQLACAHFKRLRDERYLKIIDFLQDKGIPISPQEVLRYAQNGLVGRPHFARVLVERGYVKTTREAFDKYLATEEFSKIERPKPSPLQAVQLIIKAGGAAVLAHPISLIQTGEELDATLVELISYGLCGLECFYSSNDDAFTRLSLSLAARHGLIVTVGSDFHGERVKPLVKIGCDTSLYKDYDCQSAIDALAKNAQGVK